MGKREKVSFSASLMRDLADPLGSAGVRIALQSCSELGGDSQTFIPCTDQSLDMGCPGGSLQLGQTVED